MAQNQFDVAIVGGGPVGLTTSILLSLRGISNVVFEKNPSTSIHPKSSCINQRTTEIFRVMGIEDEVYAAATPPEIAGRTAWYTSFGPEGKEIVSRDAWGGGVYAEEYRRHSPSRFCILPQLRLEPIMKRRALQLNPDSIRYNTEVVHVEQDNAGVIIKTRSGDRAEEIRARYGIIADGGRQFTTALGIKWLGETTPVEMVSVYFRSALRSLHPDPRNWMTWFSNPELGGSTKTGLLYQCGPWPLKPENEVNDEWIFACASLPHAPIELSNETMSARLRRTLAIPDLPVEVCGLTRWRVNAIYAEKYRLGRLFLVGDAAHRIPPWGALGMNTGIQDAQNLVWKLQLALQDEVRYDALLDTYHIERQPIAKLAGETSLHNVRSHSMIMDVALGLSPELSVEENKRRIAPAFDPTHVDYKKKREAIENAQKVLDCEFKAPGYEIGWFYPSLDVKSEGGKTHDGQLFDDGTLNYEFYFPTTIPGHHLPHSWVEKEGQKKALFDLIPLDKLLLLTRRSGWEDLKDNRVRHELIGIGGWKDLNGDWERQCGIPVDGAVLVRPDGIVAWRGRRGDVTSDKWISLVNEILGCI